MRKSALLQCLFGLILIVCAPVTPALAQPASVTWVSIAVGNDANDCSIAAPCKSLSTALRQTVSGGTIAVKDPGDYGAVFIDKSVNVVNDSGGTATVCCGTFDENGALANIIVVAGATDVVTFRGLTFTIVDSNPQMTGLQIYNAQQVNIDNCTFMGTTGAGILVTPGTDFQPVTVAPAMNVSVEDTIINNSGAGIRVTAVPGVHVTMTVDRTRINNNAGGGIRADATGGGAITVAVTDSTINLNDGNGVVALAGPGSAAVHVTHSFIASNAASGVQSNQANGGIANVTVRGSTLTNNVSGAVNSVGGGSLLTFGDNNIVGPNGTGFTGPIALQ